MRIIQRIEHFASDSDPLVNGKLRLSAEPIPETLALQKGHDVVQDATGLPGVEQGENVRMLELGGDPDLPQEPLAPQRAQLTAKHFDSDRPVVLEIPGMEHRSHCSMAELPLDQVAVGQCSRDLGEN